MVIGGLTCRAQLNWDANSPMHKHPATAVKSFLDEAVGGRKVLEQVFVVDIVHLNDHVREGAEQGWVQRHAEDGQHVSDISLLKSVAPA